MGRMLWATQDIEVIYFKGYKKHKLRKFKKLNSLNQAQEELENNDKNHYIYEGLKPTELFGVYKFIDDKLQRIDNASINRSKKQIR